MAATRIITNAWKVRTLPDIFYEEPERVEDDMEQWPTVFRISGLLYERYGDRPDVFINGGGFVSYDATDGNRRVAPDLFIAFDVDVAGIYENLPNFWIWEIGKAPDFVMEVASPSTAANDLGWKRELYQRLGIQEYWRFDPTGEDLYGQPIAGERLVAGRYEEYELQQGDDGSVRAHSELLGVVFSWNGQEFDALDPATGLTIDKRVAAEGRADAAEARAIVAEAELNLEQTARSQAETRAEAAEAELARLRAQLGRQEP
ncbi:MAG: Uma2 family endonuclease [Chloroflexota bacterium]|nr:Uma2 family endonuclease [Chloroflexota bacterium]MDE2683119.1 Uma2 family endonuclease [Chloroflexota bacterium]